MAWITPKINWNEDDYFELTPDWSRITGNIIALKDMARPVFGDISIKNMANPSFADLPYADILQAVEDNTESLRVNIPLTEKMQAKIDIEENGPVWNWEDLNRLEKNAFDINLIINNAKSNRQTLAFTLGGGTLACGL